MRLELSVSDKLKTLAPMRQAALITHLHNYITRPNSHLCATHNRSAV